MEIHGFQKMTMLDFPGRVACTVFTAGCNFRCPFCHNALLVTKITPTGKIDEEEVFSYLEKRKGILDGIAITGGEPLLQKDVADFMRRAKGLGYAVKLDTNGSFPEKLEELVSEGLCDYVAMDVKNRPEKYGQTVGIPDFDVTPIRESISLLLRGTVPYEFRTTVVKEFHTKEDIAALAEWIRGAQRYYLQNFVASNTLIAPGLSPVSREEMHVFRDTAAGIVPPSFLRGID